MRRAWITTITIGLAVLVGLVDAAPVAADLARDDPDGAQELAERFAPVIMLKSQPEPCSDEGEPYGPTSIDLVLDNPDIVLRQVGNDDPVVMRAPGASDLFGLGEGMYLDFPGGALAPGCIYETDFERYRAGGPAVVYAHVVQQEGHPDQLALQYWLYWYYNDWNNKHESDWEFVQLLFDAGSIDEALGSEPVSAGYAQHEGGERADWDDDKLERVGTRPFVYSSAGSHASYYGAALFMGRSGSEGFGCDNTDGPSDRYDPEVVVLPDSVDDPDDPLAWLAFEGRWGERQRGPFNGPTGPAAKDRWLEPIDWHEELRPSSVVIPAGDSDSVGIVSLFCTVVEWGSGTVIQVATSPLRLALTALVLFLVGRWLIGRTTWGAVELTPIRRRRRAGQIIRAAATAYRDRSRALLSFGLIFIPTAVVVGFVGALVAIVPLLGDALDLARGSEGANLLFAAFAGSLASLLAYLAVNGMTAAYLDALDTAESRRPAEAARHAWSRWRELVSGFLRAYVIVVVLLISVIGIPFAIRQLVRYQFIAQVAVLEGHGGAAATARSSELVRGRWLHTGVMIAVFNALLVMATTVVGLLVLVLVTGLPLWALSMVTTLIQGLLTPLLGAAQTLLYGDAVAEHAGEAAADIAQPATVGV